MRKLLLLTLLSITSVIAQAQRYLGGDVSLLPSYEKAGTMFRDSAGVAVEPMKFFKNEGKWNSIRVRLFVEPKNASKAAVDEGVVQDLDYIIPLCKDAIRNNMAVMLDIHYSDTWADPSHQTTPKAWQNTKKASLPDSVYAYTRRALAKLKANNITPDLIQVGNEITYGMLWPAGKVDPEQDDNWDFLAECLKNGVKACREICPKAKLIIHTEHAQSWKATYGFYDKLRKRGVDYDIIGLSYYPMWHGSIGNLGVVLDSLETNFPDKDIMIVECAAYYSHENDPWAKPEDKLQGFYPVNTEGQLTFTRELVSLLNRHPKVTGLYWWFPEENQSGSQEIKNWLNRGLFDNHTGRALPAFYELTKLKKDIR